MRTDEPPVVVEQSFDVSIERIWDAITKIEQMHKWYFEEIPSFVPEVGFETQFDINCEDRIFPHRWKVTAVEPGKLIQYDWRYEGYQGDAYVVFELSQDAKGAKLTVSCHVRESFPDDVPEFNRESCVGGWDYFIKQRLKNYLDPHPSGSVDIL